MDPIVQTVNQFLESGDEVSYAIVIVTKRPEGALRSGTSVVKIKALDGDAHPVGSKGIVVGHLHNAGIQEWGYWILWEDFDYPVFTTHHKIGPA